MDNRVQLEKTFKPQWIWAIALGSAIGWGCFILPTEWMGMAGPLGAIIGLGIGAILMMIIAISYGVLIEKYPVSGGEFAYAYLGFGRDHAFVCGWFLTLGYICIVALNASALALAGKFLLPSITNFVFLYEINGWQVYLGEIIIATVALIVFAYLNMKGASLSGNLQYIFCIILVAGVSLLTISMILSPTSDLSNLKPLFNPSVPTLSGIIAIIAIAPWAFVGFDNIPQAAEEFNFPPKKAFNLIIYSLIVAAGLYSFMIIATAVAVPWQQLVEGKPIWGTGDVVSSTLGIIGILLLAISLCMGIFTGLNGFYVSTSRLMFAMGRAKVIPAVFSKLHPKYGTPYVGIIFTCAVCLIAPWFGRPVLLWIVDMSATGVTIAYFYTCITAYKLFKWNESGPSEREVAPVKKFFALIGAISGLAFLGLLLIPGSSSALGTPSLIALAIWTVLGIVFYLFKRKEYHQISKSKLDYYILGKTQPNNDSNESETPPVHLDA
ncbi:APC family permease [Bacillus sp. S/N-304-OC-R1]|uniref:APC family permease n=1 Tax=Bacillus sp. S/N-304-OC-R1 TaxID=2758034 RepID=UPI001C8E25E7|nr:APC family permease [Bacillus sp. S/N-304-OC-R1]MBY0120353.1 APC family permease [Bacillus sp. S/N-304-OC-R1]